MRTRGVSRSNGTVLGRASRPRSVPMRRPTAAVRGSINKAPKERPSDSAEQVLEDLMRSLGLDWRCSLPSGVLANAAKGAARVTAPSESRLELCVVSVTPTDSHMPTPIRIGGGFQQVSKRHPQHSGVHTGEVFENEEGEKVDHRFNYGVHLKGTERDRLGDTASWANLLKRPTAKCGAYRVLKGNRPHSASEAAKVVRDLHESALDSSLTSNNHLGEAPPPLVGAVSRLLDAMGIEGSERWIASMPDVVAGSFDDRRFELCFLSVPHQPPQERRSELRRDELTLVEAPRKERIVITPVDTVWQRVPKRSRDLLERGMLAWFSACKIHRKWGVERSTFCSRRQEHQRGQEETEQANRHVVNGLQRQIPSNVDNMQVQCQLVECFRNVVINVLTRESNQVLRSAFESWRCVVTYSRASVNPLGSVETEGAMDLDLIEPHVENPEVSESPQHETFTVTLLPEDAGTLSLEIGNDMLALPVQPKLEQKRELDDGTVIFPEELKTRAGLHEEISFMATSYKELAGHTEAVKAGIRGLISHLGASEASANEAGDDMLALLAHIQQRMSVLESRLREVGEHTTQLTALASQREQQQLAHRTDFVHGEVILCNEHCVDSREDHECMKDHIGNMQAKTEEKVVQVEPIHCLIATQTDFCRSDVGLQVVPRTRDQEVQDFRTFSDATEQVEPQTRTSDVQTVVDTRVCDVQTEVSCAVKEVQTDHSVCNSYMQENLENLRTGLDDAMSRVTHHKLRLESLLGAIRAIQAGKEVAEERARMVDDLPVLSAYEYVVSIMRDKVMLEAEKRRVQAALTTRTEAATTIVDSEEIVKLDGTSGDLEMQVAAVVSRVQELELQKDAVSKASAALIQQSNDAKVAAKEAGDGMLALHAHVASLQKQTNELESTRSELESQRNELESDVSHVRSVVSALLDDCETAAAVHCQTSSLQDVMSCLAHEHTRASLHKQQLTELRALAGGSLCHGELLCLDNNADDVEYLKDYFQKMALKMERSQHSQEDLRSQLVEYECIEPLHELIVVRQGLSALHAGGDLAELAARELGGCIAGLQRLITMSKNQATSMKEENRKLVQEVHELKESANRGHWRALHETLPWTPQGLFLMQSPSIKCEECGKWAAQELRVLERVVERTTEVEVPVRDGIEVRRARASNSCVEMVHRSVQTLSGECSSNNSLKPSYSFDAGFSPMGKHTLSTAEPLDLESHSGLDTIVHTFPDRLRVEVNESRSLSDASELRSPQMYTGALTDSRINA